MKMQNLLLEHMVPVSLLPFFFPRKKKKKKNSLDNIKSTVFSKGTVKEDAYPVVYIYAHTLFFYVFAWLTYKEEFGCLKDFYIYIYLNLIWVRIFMQVCSC